MLKRPHRKANATASPVRIERRRDQISVCWRLNAAVTRARPHPGEEVEAGALEDRLVGRERVLPRRRDQHDDGPDEKKRAARSAPA